MSNRPSFDALIYQITDTPCASCCPITTLLFLFQGFPCSWFPSIMWVLISFLDLLNGPKETHWMKKGHATIWSTAIKGVNEKRGKWISLVHYGKSLICKLYLPATWGPPTIQEVSVLGKMRINLSGNIFLRDGHIKERCSKVFKRRNKHWLKTWCSLL